MQRRSFFPTSCLSAVLLLFCTAVFFAPRAMAAQDNAGAVVGVVSTFYTNYIKALRGNADYHLSRQPQVDASFVQKIDALIADAQKSAPGFLDYDPILMAQDVPEGMEYAKPAINGDSAELVAYTLWSGGSKHAIRISLVKKDNAWRITDVIDMETPDASSEGHSRTSPNSTKRKRANSGLISARPPGSGSVEILQHP